MNTGNNNKLYPMIALLMSISLLLGACSAPAPSPTPMATTIPPATAEPTNILEPITQAELVGAIWQLVGGREPLSSPPFQVPAPEKYTLTFSEDGSLFVQADCNTSRGTYQLSGSQLTISLGATTLVACEEGSLSDEFMANLGKAATAGSGFGNLMIGLADEAGEMYFHRTAAPDLASNLEPISQEEMVDILWQWTSLEEPPPAPGIGVGDPALYDIVFRADSTYSAKADCNRLNGNFVLNGSQLTINPGISTLVACEPDSRSDQYASLLWRVTGVAQKDGMLVLLLDDGSSAMSFVNAGASPVATPAPVVEGDPASVLGTPDGVENFDNANNWTNFTSECFNSEITSGQFVMTANGVPQFSCWEFSWPRLENFYLETTQLMPTTCQPDDRFGFIFRAPDTNRGYLYGFNCAGQYSLTVWDGQTTTTLVRPTVSNAIRQGPGAVNVMGLMAFGENISLYANGVYLQTVADFTFLDTGKFGYFVRAATENPFTVRYDQLRVWSLEDELFPPDLSQTFPTEDLPTPAPNVPTGEARVNVNVRTGPSTLFPILGTAMQGDTGQVLGINPNGTWYAVSVPTNRVGTGIAWVSADFVNLTNPTAQPLPVITPPLLPTTVNFPAPAPNAPQAVMREPATLRSGPTLEFPIFGVAVNGSRAELIGQSQDGEWWAIRVPTTLTSDGIAWVAKVYTSVINAGNVPTLRTPDLPRNITPAAPASGAPALITIEPLNVRIGPGNQYSSLGAVARGTALAVIGVSPDREFFVVNIPTSIDASGQGWVPARFVNAQNVGNVPVIQPPPVR
jgi:heat shock protein HslJ/uncharacterized protein YraI